ncbi:MAG: methionyl-tRNA formyltransferase [Gordonibacter sp.]|uniref:methionyl-tRNA formyltransferase n=1 Tax=Gordonibacter sp. TaxID=1968902 RepID=UPI002FCBAA5A
MMRLVFMGTPDFAATILEDLSQQHEVVAVYTRPDAVRGRGKQLAASPVKAMAERLGLPVRTPKTLRDEAEQQALAALEPEVICVAAYGAILPKAVLDIPRFGCLNVHASLLPRWRGAAPVERAILAGDIETGVCVMRMEEGLDTGAYCVCRTARIDTKSASKLTDELANLGSHALLTALVLVQGGAADWTDQDEAKVTYASKVGKGELFLAPSDTVIEAVRKAQASSTAHPARAVVAGRAVTVTELGIPVGTAVELTEGMVSGTVRFAGKRLFLGLRDGVVEVVSLKPDGKQSMDGRSFAAGVQGIKGGSVIWEAAHE